MSGGNFGDPEYECVKCGVRLDPLMTADEAEFFLINGCILCDNNQGRDGWRIVVPDIIKEETA
jgi:hypothetical protein